MHPPSPLLGRNTEIEVLTGLVTSVRGGRSEVLILRGESGIGKTALLDHLVAEASGFRVARAVGVESEMELPFAGLHELCVPLLDRMDRLADHQREALGIALGLESGSGTDRFLVAVAALGLFSEASDDRPLLCVVDDAHWLDTASAQVLGFVGRRLLAESIALVFAARAPVASPDPLSGLSELYIEGLSDEAARALLATVTSGPIDESVRARIIEETHGNPLALMELSKGLDAVELAGGFALPVGGDLPKRLKDQYVSRIREMTPDAQRLILLAAADPVGDSSLVLRAARSLGLGGGALDLPAVNTLLDIGVNVRFRHPLIRSAAYHSATIEDRRAAHRALAAATDPEADADRRAWHRAQAAFRPR